MSRSRQRPAPPGRVRVTCSGRNDPRHRERLLTSDLPPTPAERDELAGILIGAER
jgi:hypothetical protein